MEEIFMKEALKEAQKAYKKDEVPIGAVIVKEGIIIARGHNLKEKENNPILHAEMIAINKAAQKVKSWRLTGCDIYVTIEPCPMCAGAMVQARLDRIIFGAKDPKTGSAGSLYNLVQDPRLNHRLKVVEGMLEGECSRIIKKFFRKKRERNKEAKVKPNDENGIW